MLRQYFDKPGFTAQHKVVRQAHNPLNIGKKYLFLSILLCALFSAHSQSTLDDKFGRAGLNTITTAVPFLIIAPDSRSGAMGDAGVATSPDANSVHWNPAKFAFVEKGMGFSLSYVPWLRKLVPDINLSYLSGYKKLDDMSTISASLLYFSLGDIQFTDAFGNNTTQFRPNEFAFDVSFARKLSKYFSGGISVRYINSNLTGGVLVEGQASRPGQAVAADVSGYFQKDDIKIGNKKSVVAAGINISNIGNKMSYTTSSKRDFIPINMRLGPRLTVNLDDYNSISITGDINKLLVPTRPIYKTDAAGNAILGSDGNQIIIAGKDPNRAVASGMFGSFSDAPGVPVRDENNNIVLSPDGMAQIEKSSIFKEELREFTFSTGLEYWYDKQFAVRTGYFYEHPLKGNRKYITVGAGLRYNVFALDFAYLIPAYFGKSATSTNRSPLENTLRFTLLFDFEAFKAQQEEVPAGN